MRAHHRRALESYVGGIRELPDSRGVILVGSVARGTERPTSDVDVYEVVTDAAFDSALERREIARVERCEHLYPGGYIDVKLVSRRFLDAAVTEGDDPLRASFEGAQVIWDAQGGLIALVEQILDPPDLAWDDRVRGFSVQAYLHGGYFLPGALQRGDVMAAHWANAHLCQAAARAMLAKHHTLYRGAKYLTGAFRALEVPQDFRSAWEAAVGRPDERAATRLLEALRAEVGAMSVDDRLSRFIVDNELAWYRGVIPPEYS